jgi:hypothetical protein
VVVLCCCRARGCASTSGKARQMAAGTAAKHVRTAVKHVVTAVKHMGTAVRPRVSVRTPSSRSGSLGCEKASALLPMGCWEAPVPVADEG